MPRIKIVDGARSIEIEDDSVTLNHLFVLATDTLDHRAQEGMWLPMAYREQMANKQTTND